jgi:arsenate reductase (glutaredoxin)
MNRPIIYHNPRCSKSRQTLKILQDHGLTPTIIEYLKTPPDAKDLKQILTKLNISPRELLRNNEPEYKENQLDNKNLSDDEIIQAIIKHPILMERPIVILGNKAIIGRPPEKVNELL